MLKQDYTDDIDSPADPASDAYVAQLVADFLADVDPAQVQVDDVVYLLAQLDPNQQIAAGYLLRDAGVPTEIVMEAYYTVEAAVVVEGESPTPPPPPVVVPVPPPVVVVPAPARPRSALRVLFGIASIGVAVGVGYAVGKRYGRRL